ncbi:MAG TPA: glycosyltransferase [Candidatus Dormibacteraeota bacterium]|nr:glycosyltransferase [Candidatus Dormibacteraeota bacterium]
MIRVAQVVTRLIAGAGGVALRGALALDRSRFQITIVSADGGPLLREAERAGLLVVRVGHMRPELSPAHDVLGLRELTALLRPERFDIVHTHSAKAGALGRMAAHRMGVPAVVHTFHGFPFHDFQSGLRRRSYIAVERRLGRITDRFLAVGSAVAAEAIRLRLAPADRIRTIGSAIDDAIEPACQESRAAARRSMGLPDHAQVVGTVGRLDRQKAPLDMVEAARRLDRPDVHFVWIGGGPLRDAVLRHVARRGLAGRFHVLGERGDVKRLLPGLDVFAMSSRYEGIPCAAVEAMMAGIPVVATAVNSVPEIVVPGRTGLLVPPAAPAQLSGAVAYVLDHAREAAGMAVAARAQLGDRFSPEVLGRDLMETYAAALAAPAVGAGPAPLALTGSR